VTALHYELARHQPERCPRNGHPSIAEWTATFERMLEELRKTARAEEWPDLSSGYRTEIQRMQRDILDYLSPSR